MKDTNPLIIQLYNMDESVINRFNKEKLEHTHHSLNGLIEVKGINEIYYNHDLPKNIHEADFIVIDTTARCQNPDNTPSIVKIKVPGTMSHYNLMPLDIHAIMGSVHKTRHSQCVIFFMNTYFEHDYVALIEDNKKPSTQEYNMIGVDFNNNYERPSFKQGNYFSHPGHNKYIEITNLLIKYMAKSSYNVVFPYHGDNITLLNSKSKEIVSLVTDGFYKKIFYFPDIEDKAGFLAELFTSVLPAGDFDFMSKNLSDFGDFRWINDFSYLSHKERSIRILIEDEKSRHLAALQTLEEKLSFESQLTENIKLKKLLTDTGEELKESVHWFMEYIGFDNILNPDEENHDVDQKVLEEDIRIVSPDVTYIIETKGLGGTSSDSDCAQPSKIVLRKEDADQAKNNGLSTVNYKAVYIVNSQRYKEPKVRDNPPFKPQQIVDARIARRAMTTTYELFNVFHMIEAGILSKTDVRNAFKQNGLINFKFGLLPLSCDARFDRHGVYSFELTNAPNLQIDENDSIVFQDDDDHWHLSLIASLEINRSKVSSANALQGVNVGVKVKKYISSAKNFYLKKN